MAADNSSIVSPSLSPPSPPSIPSSFPQIYLFSHLRFGGAATAAGCRESGLIWNRAPQRDTLSEKEKGWRDGEKRRRRRRRERGREEKVGKEDDDDEEEEKKRW